MTKTTNSKGQTEWSYKGHSITRVGLSYYVDYTGPRVDLSSPTWRSHDTLGAAKAQITALVGGAR